MSVGYGGAFITSSDISTFRVDIQGSQTSGNESQTNSLLGVVSNDLLFEVGNNFDGSAHALTTYDNLDGIRATDGPTSFRMGGDLDTTKPGYQVLFDRLGLAETDFVNTNANLIGGYCFFNGNNNYIPTTPIGCITGTGSASFPGYTTTPQITSGISGNSDLNGVLSFSSTTSATYTFLDPNRQHVCVFTPAFDYGSGTRFWQSTAANPSNPSGTLSVTLQFSTAVSGAVGYVCTGKGS
jgi:hypothetical protein